MSDEPKFDKCATCGCCRGEHGPDGCECWIVEFGGERKCDCRAFQAGYSLSQMTSGCPHVPLASERTPMTTTTLQAEHDTRRKAYLDAYRGDEEGSRLHNEFYLWLADAIGVTVADLPVSLDRIAQSTDPHLNDIALTGWDRRDPIVRHKAVQAGMRSWSLSDTVCVLKAFARRAADRAVRP
jgi:hypothetical protein